MDFKRSHSIISLDSIRDVQSVQFYKIMGLTHNNRALWLRGFIKTTAVLPELFKESAPCRSKLFVCPVNVFTVLEILVRSFHHHFTFIPLQVPSVPPTVFFIKHGYWWVIQSQENLSFVHPCARRIQKCCVLERQRRWGSNISASLCPHCSKDPFPVAVSQFDVKLSPIQHLFHQWKYAYHPLSLISSFSPVFNTDSLSFDQNINVFYLL